MEKKLYMENMCPKEWSQTTLSFWKTQQNNHHMQEIVLKIKYFVRELSKSLTKVNFIIIFFF